MDLRGKVGVIDFDIELMVMHILSDMLLLGRLINLIIVSHSGICGIECDIYLFFYFLDK